MFFMICVPDELRRDNATMNLVLSGFVVTGYSLFLRKVSLLPKLHAEVQKCLFIFVLLYLF